ncbi:hypothetical protein LCGC14_0480990 [marine sediment metagenome]|uniref:Transposase n=1 Tax=marine sediment metagenome TaxID=412755 RepID=A0A0F9S9C3_9ZZZZ
MVTKTRCPRCLGNLYPYEGGMKCLQCSRSFGGPEPEAKVAPKHYSPEFKERAVRVGKMLGSWAKAGSVLGIDAKYVQSWSRKR